LKLLVPGSFIHVHTLCDEVLQFRFEAALEIAIANHRKAKKLMQAWEQETERLLDAQAPRKP
jgi:hypothetical protein